MAGEKQAEIDKGEKKKINKEAIKKLTGIFQYVLPYKWPFIVGLALLIITSGLVMAFPFLSGKLIDAASGKGDWVTSDLNTIAGILIGILLLQGIISYIRVYLFAVVSEKSMADIRFALYDKLMRLPFSFYDKNRVGELISRITADVSLLQNTFSITLAELIRQVAILIIGTAAIFYTTTQLSLFMLATFPVIVIFAIIFGRYIRRLSKQTQDELANTNVIVEETLQSINTVKTFTSELFEALRYQKSIGQVVQTALRAAKYRAAFISFIIFVLFGAIVAIMWYGALLVQSGDMTVGELLSFVLYTTFIGGSIAGLGDQYGQVQRSVGASERVLEVLGEANEETIAETDSLHLDGTIEFMNVVFSYPTRNDVRVINHVNFKIGAGQKIALVGPSGAGKSTIVQLLMRFYDLTEGQIFVDGKDIRAFPLYGYRKNIGIVPQEVILFGGTIKENIAYGNHEASFEAIEDAARKANAFDFIKGFPEGFDTIVGERGVKLSGGQRQRIAIARAILKNPSILILDEATSSLDAASEQLVQDALEKLMEGRTSIIIAHRLSTVRKADVIMVLKEGQIIESGTHEELAKIEDGIYSELIKLQFMGEESPLPA